MKKYGAKTSRRVNTFSKISGSKVNLAQQEKIESKKIKEEAASLLKRAAKYGVLKGLSDLNISNLSGFSLIQISRWRTSGKPGTSETAESLMKWLNRKNLPKLVKDFKEKLKSSGRRKKKKNVSHKKEKWIYATQTKDLIPIEKQR